MSTAAHHAHPRPRAARPGRPLRVAARAGTLGLLGGLLGCFGSPAADEFYYVLAAPAQGRNAAQGPTLALMPLQVAPGYESQRLVYRGSAHELRYYAYRRWAADPAELVTRTLMRHLRASGHFARVDDEAQLPGAQGQLSGTIEAIEELDRGDATYAHLAATLLLKRPDGAVVLRQDFDETRPCPTRDPRQVVAQLSQILADQAARLAPRAAGALRHP